MAPVDDDAGGRASAWARATAIYDQLARDVERSGGDLAQMEVYIDDDRAAGRALIHMECVIAGARGTAMAGLRTLYGARLDLGGIPPVVHVGPDMDDVLRFDESDEPDAGADPVPPLRERGRA